MYGSVLERGLEILETCIIKLYKCDKVRHDGIVELLGTNGDNYKFYPTVNYCSCKSFNFEVRSRKNLFTCKHNVAARLSIVLQRIQVIQVDESKFREVILDMYKQADERNLKQH